MTTKKAVPLPTDQNLDDTTASWLRRYAAGEVSWRELRERLDTDDFNVVLSGLAKLNLRLPRSDPNRPTKARGWLRDAIAEAKARANHQAQMPVESV